ncbi:vitamin K-dependent protein C-like [Daphnia pulicaria]|uniref:vitamin K-dependent protein C-like n=1 Tax=Daphnia pulicaria TaxID=35523 RepID=UPI001EECA91B|nr:vitamin K-dependent protein C-like [Daphnia pulicaria]
MDSDIRQLPGSATRAKFNGGICLSGSAQHQYPIGSESQRYWGIETFIHPNWNPTTKAGDIALVKLSTVVEYTKYIHPICLPNPASEPDYANQNVTVTGFAVVQLDDNDPSVILYKMNVTVASNSDCNATLNNIMTDQMMCTRGAADSGICTVDEGNPMMVKQADGRYKQIGIVLILAPYTECQFGLPFTYTRLSSYSSWVNNITSPSTTIASTTPTTPTTSTSPSSSATIQTSPAILLLVSLISFSMNF